MNTEINLKETPGYVAPSAVCYEFIQAAVLCESADWTGTTTVDGYGDLDSPEDLF